MQGDEIQRFLIEFWTDLQRPDVLWQVVVLGACLLVAWALARLLRGRKLPVVYQWRAGQSGLNRILFPLTAVALVEIARYSFAYLHLHTRLLGVAVPLLVSLAIIRAVMFALRQAFSPSGWLGTFERFLAAMVWIVVALHILGLLPGIIENLESITLSLGKQKFTLWLLLQGSFTVLVTLLLALWISGLIDHRLMRAESLDSSLRVVFARVARSLLVLLAVLISLPLVGLDLTTLSVFGGALGVGLGFGLQKIASNYVSGFIILLDRSIRMGNMITVDKYSGQVTEITTRYTVLRAGNGIEAIVPNETLIGSVVQNQTYTDTHVRQTAEVQIGYGSDVDRALALLVEIARRHPRVMADPAPAALLTRFADSGIDLELGFWITDPQNGTGNVRSDLLLEIWREFRRAGIEIPYPQREVRLIRSQSTAS